MRAAQRLVAAVDARIDYYLGLASDPAVELVDMVADLRRQKAELEVEVKSKATEVGVLRAKEQDLTQKLRSMRAELDRAKKEQRRANRAFDALAHDNLAAAIEMYSTPDRIRQHKPDG